MVKKYLAILFLIISTNVYSNDFRGSSWGDTLPMVKTNETSEILVEEKNGIIYKAEIAGIAMHAVYIFENDKLVRGLYTSTEKYSNKNKYIDDYQAIKNLLINKYGQPHEDQVKWMGDLFRDDPDRHGLAVSAGQLVYFADWETDTTEITCFLIGESHEISLTVMYTDLSSKDQLEQQRKQQAIDQL